ncbi:MAG: lytic murein transglycosylase [Actinomycetes bacterium]
MRTPKINFGSRIAALSVASAVALAIAAPAGADKNVVVTIKGTDGTPVTQPIVVKDSDPTDPASIAARIGVAAEDILSLSVTDIVKPPDPKPEPKPKPKPKPKPGKSRDGNTAKPKPQAGRKANANPIAGPAMFGLPGLTPLGTPGELISEFRIPPFLLPIYQAAGIEYGIPWQILAAINSIETDYGRNLSVSSAGALGWMQFMPGTWAAYGVDANGDGKADPYNPADAIFAAARYLKASGGVTDLRAAIFSYNHADWYVNDVLKRARLLVGLPDELVTSLTGLAQAMSPVPGASRVEKNAAANGEAKSVTISAKPNSPVIAVADATVVKVGFDEKTAGNYVTVKDNFGNRFTYANLGQVSRRFVTRAPRKVSTKKISTELKLDLRDERGDGRGSNRAPVVAQSAATVAGAPLLTAGGSSRRIFANPARPEAFKAGGAKQIKEATGPANLRDWFTVPVNISRNEALVKTIKPGSTVIAGTILGRVNSPVGADRGTFTFSIRPAGKDAPVIDPRPIISGWKLLDRTARGEGEGDSRKLAKASGVSGADPSIGQVMLMSKSSLARRVLGDQRITIYECGRSDIEAGIVDSRILATLLYLANRGMNPTVSSLKCGHGYYTTSGNVSEHSFGSAVDIAAINGVPILGNQGVGSITDRANRALVALQGTMRPHQIISLMTYPGADNTFAMGDHDDHIHVGFQPEAGAKASPAAAVGSPGGASSSQWSTLVDRLRELPNPKVTTKTSRYATDGKRR